MNQPSHKRPRRSVMRQDILDHSKTGRSVVLLDRARSYLTGDEVFEELYGHAVDLEKLTDDTEEKDGREKAEGLLGDLCDDVKSNNETLKRKDEATTATVRAVTAIIEDGLIPSIDSVLASSLVDNAETNEVADALQSIRNRLLALASDLDDVTSIKEEIDALDTALENASE